MAKRLTIIPLIWMAFMAGCTDTPRAAYSRMVQALVQLDPGAYVKTLTGPRERMDYAHASIDCARSLVELKQKVTATRGPDGWDRFCEVRIGKQGTEDDIAAPPASAPAVASQPAEESDEEPTFAIDGDTARMLEAGEDAGWRLVRINGRWYFDLSSNEDYPPDDILLTETTLYRRLASRTREFAREFDDPDFDLEQAGESYGRLFYSLAAPVSDWLVWEYRMREALAQGRPHFPFVFCTKERVREILRTRPTVHITTDGIMWGSEETPITIQELSARLTAMNLRGKFPSERWVVVSDDKGVPAADRVEALKAMIAAGALPMAPFEDFGVEIPTPDGDGEPDTPK